MEVTLSLSRSAVFNEVARSSSYTGAKMPDDADAYARIPTVDEDEDELCRFWDESRADLGTLNWIVTTFVNQENGFRADINNGKAGYQDTGAICDKYEYFPQAIGSESDKGDKCMWKRGTNVVYRVYIHDSSYTDAATFKAAMNGVILNYELATPIVYHFEPMNNVYRVEQGGTEEVLERDTLAPEGYNPLTAPMRADIRYGVDVVGILENLKKDYVSKESIQVFLSALGTQMGGTWSMTWNETTERYDFVFTPNA